MSLRTVKILTAVTKLLTVGGGIYAISEGADPMTVYAIIGMVVVGPDAIEMVLANTEDE